MGGGCMRGRRVLTTFFFFGGGRSGGLKAITDTTIGIPELRVEG